MTDENGRCPMCGVTVKKNMITFKIESVDCEAGTVSGQGYTTVDGLKLSSSFGVDDLIGATATAVLRNGVFDLISITASGH